MTNPKHTPIYCTACYKVLGKRPGTTPVLGVVCDDPVCEYQGPADLYAQRDGAVLALVQSGIGPSQIAQEFSVSRQRVYQIFNRWKQGV